MSGKQSVKEGFRLYSRQTKAALQTAMSSWVLDPSLDLPPDPPLDPPRFTLVPSIITTLWQLTIINAILLKALPRKVRHWLFLISQSICGNPMPSLWCLHLWCLCPWCLCPWCLCPWCLCSWCLYWATLQRRKLYKFLKELCFLLQILKGSWTTSFNSGWILLKSLRLTKRSLTHRYCPTTLTPQSSQL